MSKMSSQSPPPPPSDDHGNTSNENSTSYVPMAPVSHNGSQQQRPPPTTVHVAPTLRHMNSGSGSQVSQSSTSMTSPPASSANNLSGVQVHPNQTSPLESATGRPSSQMTSDSYQGGYSHYTPSVSSAMSGNAMRYQPHPQALMGTGHAVIYQPVLVPAPGLYYAAPPHMQGAYMYPQPMMMPASSGHCCTSCGSAVDTQQPVRPQQNDPACMHCTRQYHNLYHQQHQPQLQGNASGSSIASDNDRGPPDEPTVSVRSEAPAPPIPAVSRQQNPPPLGGRYHSGARLELGHGRTPLFGGAPSWWGEDEVSDNDTNDNVSVGHSDTETVLNRRSRQPQELGNVTALRVVRRRSQTPQRPDGPTVAHNAKIDQECSQDGVPYPQFAKTNSVASKSSDPQADHKQDEKAHSHSGRLMKTPMAESTPVVSEHLPSEPQPVSDVMTKSSSPPQPRVRQPPVRMVIPLCEENAGDAVKKPPPKSRHSEPGTAFTISLGDAQPAPKKLVGPAPKKVHGQALFIPAENDAGTVDGVKKPISLQDAVAQRRPNLRTKTGPPSNTKHTAHLPSPGDNSKQYLLDKLLAGGPQDTPASSMASKKSDRYYPPVTAPKVAMRVRRDSDMSEGMMSQATYVVKRPGAPPDAPAAQPTDKNGNSDGQNEIDDAELKLAREGIERALTTVALSLSHSTSDQVVPKLSAPVSGSHSPQTLQSPCAASEGNNTASSQKGDMPDDPDNQPVIVPSGNVGSTSGSRKSSQCVPIPPFGATFTRAGKLQKYQLRSRLDSDSTSGIGVQNEPIEDVGPSAIRQKLLNELAKLTNRDAESKVSHIDPSPRDMKPLAAAKAKQKQPTGLSSPSKKPPNVRRSYAGTGNVGPGAGGSAGAGAAQQFRRADGGRFSVRNGQQAVSVSPRHTAASRNTGWSFGPNSPARMLAQTKAQKDAWLRSAISGNSVRKSQPSYVTNGTALHRRKNYDPRAAAASGQNNPKPMHSALSKHEQFANAGRSMSFHASKLESRAAGYAIHDSPDKGRGATNNGNHGGRQLKGGISLEDLSSMRDEELLQIEEGDVFDPTLLSELTRASHGAAAEANRMLSVLKHRHASDCPPDLISCLESFAISGTSQSDTQLPEEMGISQSENKQEKVARLLRDMEQMQKAFQAVGQLLADEKPQTGGTQEGLKDEHITK